MTNIDPIPETTWAASDVTYLARVLMNGIYIKQATIASIQRTITDITVAGSAEEVSTDTLTVNESVYDTLQTDSKWSEDSVGYNFLNLITGEDLPDDDSLYQVEYKFTGSNGEVFWVVQKLLTGKIYADD